MPAKDSFTGVPALLSERDDLKTIFCWHSHIMVLMPPENTEINHSLYGDLRATIIELLPLKFHFSSVCGQVQGMVNFRIFRWHQYHNV